MTIKDKIQTWCDQSISMLVAEYDNKGRRASGQWEKDLESRVSETPTGYKVQLLGSHYTYWMEKGRKPGKFPPMKAIRKWIDDKGIMPKDKISKDSLAFLIARKIAREGYEGKPFVDSVLSDKWFNELLNSVGLFMSIEIKQQIIDEFKKAS